MGSWKTKVKIEGRNKLMAKLRERGRVNSVLVEVHYKGTEGRDANTNAKISGIQKHKYKRDPWFIKAPERKKLQRYFVKQIRRITKGQASRLNEAAEKIGEGMAEAYRQHILTGKSKQGPMPKLAKSTAIRKAKKFGHVLPALVATKQLLRSIAYRVKRP